MESKRSCRQLKYSIGGERSELALSTGARVNYNFFNNNLSSSQQRRYTLCDGSSVGFDQQSPQSPQSPFPLFSFPLFFLLIFVSRIADVTQRWQHHVPETAVALFYFELSSRKEVTADRGTVLGRERRCQMIPSNFCIDSRNSCLFGWRTSSSEVR